MTPSEIKSGMKFGHWTVLKYSHTNKHRIKYFLCKCDCGIERAVRGTALIQGTSTACSKQCDNNIIGQKFGKWTVLKVDKSRPRYYWCRCECGTERSVQGSALTTNRTKSCGCGMNIKHGINQSTLKEYQSYVGKKCGHLEILSLNKAGGYFTCKCECGKEAQVSTNSVVSGNATSCGCLRAKTLRKNLQEKYELNVGKTINHLTIDKCFYKNNSFWYDCTCSCGTQCVFQATKVATNYVQSCGCIKSKAEERMSSFLQKNNILFKREYKLKDCCDKQPLPFDFAFFNKDEELLGLMELNGQQHYIEQGWATKERVKYQQKHDRIKHQFCLTNGIPFLVIPYQFYDELEKFLTSSNFWEIITENSND